MYTQDHLDSGVNLLLFLAVSLMMYLDLYILGGK